LLKNFLGWPLLFDFIAWPLVQPAYLVGALAGKKGSKKYFLTPIPARRDDKGDESRRQIAGTVPGFHINNHAQRAQQRMKIKATG